MILRGIFLATAHESDWFYNTGTRHFYPQEWEAFSSFIPEAERSNLIEAYYRRLNSSDLTTVAESAKRWSTWELTCIRMGYDGELIKQMIKESPPIAIARIETHYFIHHFFLPQDDWIIQQSAHLKDIPLTIIQGRYDLLCPPSNAYRLIKNNPQAILHIIQEGGHSSSDPMMLEALIQACHP
jgi:proline iminopeptidase